MLGRASVGLLLGLLTVFPAMAQDLQEGTAGYARGDYATALREIAPLAEAGDARAQNNLGLMFHRGHGVPRNDALAAAWFRMAAEQAHASAQYNLAVMYLKGEGVPRDYGQALFWFRKAAEQGHAKAQYNLGVMHLRGDGVPQNPVTSAAWLREAAARGHAGAREALASFHWKRPGRVVKAQPGAGGRGDARPAPEQKTAAPSPEQVSPPAEASQGSGRGAFRIQLGAVRLQSVAEQEAERLNRVHGPVLGDARVLPVRADLGERGVFWRLRAGPFEDRATARALCDRIAERNQACIVVKN